MFQFAWFGTHRQEKILGFHIAVSNVFGMAVGHGLEHFGAQISGVGFRVGLLFSNPVKQIPTRHEFHDDKVTVLFLKEINEGYNVGMVQRG